MYSWGGDTSDWRKPGGYRYDSGREEYYDELADLSRRTGGRSYVTSGEADLRRVDPYNKQIYSGSQTAIVLAVDVTGSMASWPAEIFDRLPLFYQTLSQYREDLEISFGAIGDATCDRFPLQVNAFGKGMELEEHLKALGCEGGGGGGLKESYELFAYFILSHCHTPNAVDPFLFIYGDEGFYPTVNRRQVNHLIGDQLPGNMESSQVWQALLRHFNVYYLQKDYGHGNGKTTKQINRQWSDAIGSQRVIRLPSCERAVDVAMGIVAKHWGQYGDFQVNMAARQENTQIQVVDRTVESVFVPGKMMDRLRGKFAFFK
jgi:hypothetical protein